MTMNSVSKQSDRQSRGFWVIALVIVFAIAAFGLTRPITDSASLSPVAGLMALKASAQAAMPYEIAIANGKPTLIEFYADWCTTCQSMASSLSALHQDFGTSINFVMLNIDDPQWRDQVQQFQVRGVPHLALVTRDQVVADTFIGKVPKTVLRNRVMDLLG